MTYLHPALLDQFESATSSSSSASATSSTLLDCGWFLENQHDESQPASSSGNSSNNSRNSNSKVSMATELLHENWAEAADRWEQYREVLKERAASAAQEQRCTRRRAMLVAGDEWVSPTKQERRRSLIGHAAASSAPSSSSTSTNAKHHNHLLHRRNSKSGNNLSASRNGIDGHQREENEDDDEEEEQREALRVGAALARMMKHREQQNGAFGKPTMMMQMQDNVNSNFQTTTATTKATLNQQSVSTVSSSSSSSYVALSTLTSALDVETAHDLQYWCEALNSGGGAPANSTTISGSAAAASASAGGGAASSSSSSSSSTMHKNLAAVPEALRWMLVAERTVEQRDWVSGVKNYSNALKAQLRKTTLQHPQDQPPPIRQLDQNQNDSSQATVLNSSAAGTSSVQQLTAAEKVVVAVLYSNRAACRLGLFDFDGCLHDANEALSYCAKHPPALARCAQCLLLQPSVFFFSSSSASSSSSSGGSSSSATTTATAAQKMLERCDTANSNCAQNLAAVGPLSCVGVVSKFDTTALRAAAGHMAEFEKTRNYNGGGGSGGGGIVSALQSVSDAASSVNDPRFDLLRIEIVALSGAYDEAAAEAATLCSMAPGLADAWAMRGSFIFKATPDGSGAAAAVGMFRKAADVLRSLNNDIGRVVVSVFSSSSSSAQGAAIRAIPKQQQQQQQQQQQTSLLSAISKNTAVADSLQKIDRLQAKFASLFFGSTENNNNNGERNCSGASQVCTELLNMDLLGNRPLRALTLLRRAMCLCELGSASRGVDDASTALDMLALGQQQPPQQQQQQQQQQRNSSVFSAFLPFTVALYAVRAQCHQKAHSIPRALEDIELALLALGELETQLQQQQQQQQQQDQNGHNNNNNNNTENQNENLFQTILSRHSEVRKFCNRAHLLELQETFKAMRFNGTTPAGDFASQARYFRRQQRAYQRQHQRATSGATGGGGADHHHKQNQQSEQDTESDDDEDENSFHQRYRSTGAGGRGGGASSSSSSNNSNNTTTTTHYQTLGVSSDADKKAIVKAFRLMSLQWHPDRWTRSDVAAQKQAEEQFKLINAAHIVLKDEESRQRYDASISVRRK